MLSAKKTPVVIAPLPFAEKENEVSISSIL